MFGKKKKQSNDNPTLPARDPIMYSGKNIIVFSGGSLEVCKLVDQYITKGYDPISVDVGYGYAVLKIPQLVEANLE